MSCYRSAGEESCDQASQWGEVLPHVLPNVSWSTTRDVEYVCLCVCLSVYLLQYDSVYMHVCFCTYISMYIYIVNVFKTVL